jgi:hypothetical protein
MKLLKQHLDNEFGVNLTKALSVPDHLVRLSDGDLTAKQNDQNVAAA